VNLKAREAHELEELIIEFQGIFTIGSDGYKWSDIVCHNTDMSHARLICQPSHRFLLAKQAEVDEMMKDMKGPVITEESDSPWSSPVVLIRKKNGSPSFLCGLLMGECCYKEELLLITKD
jgi:hypothetical protein